MDNLKINDFLNYKFVYSLESSPNKNHTAFVVTESDYENNKYKSNIWVMDSKTKTHFKLTALDEEKSFIWLNERTLLFPSNNRDPKLKKKVDEGETWTSYHSINIDGGEANKYMNIPLNVVNIKKIDEDHFIVTAIFDNYAININNLKGDERSKAVEKIKEECDYQVLDEIPYWFNGKGFINKKRNRLYIYNKKDETVTPITDEFTDVSYYDYSEDKILFVSTTYKNKLESESELSEYNIKTKETKKLIEQGVYKIQFAMFLGENIICALSDMKEYGKNENCKFYAIKNNKLEFLKDHDTWIIDTVGSDSKYGGGKNYRVENNKLYFPTTIDKTALLNTIDINGNEEILSLDNGSIGSYTLLNDDEILFTGLRALKLEEVYSLKNKEESQITHFNDDIHKEKYLSKPKELNFINDGIEIKGWVLEPINFDKNKKYPAILDIHGGPKTVYGEVFFHEMQVWANMGYFVLFSNPRGSDGRGNTFADIRGKYGTVDYDDLMKLVDTALEKYPAIDKDKLGVTGGSYGGFMTNWIIGHTDRFKCAASQRSISNWASKFGITDIGYSFNQDQQGSSPWDNPDKLWWHSPLKYADKVTTPTLFIHSDEDYRCTLEQALQMFTALKYHGVEARVCVFKGENHELSRNGKPKHRARRLEEITNWFEKYLK